MKNIEKEWLELLAEYKNIITKKDNEIEILMREITNLRLVVEKFKEKEIEEFKKNISPSTAGSIGNNLCGYNTEILCTHLEKRIREIIEKDYNLKKEKNIYKDEDIYIRTLLYDKNNDLSIRYFEDMSRNEKQLEVIFISKNEKMCFDL